MSVLFRNFRRWWQPPRKIGDRPEHRQVSFLELFYDLVYVVLISQLTHALTAKIDLEHIGTFAFLFVIVWWAWINGAAYHELHGNNDIRTRVFTFLQMFCVAAMAVFAHYALGKTSVGFALSYAAFQLILAYLWWRTGAYDIKHRALSRPYVFTFILATLMFVGSIFVETPWRFYIWGVAVLITVLLPIFTSFLRRSDPEVQLQFDQSRQATHSLVERFGLFTIIVLGEVIIGVVRGVAEQKELTTKIGVVGGLGMLIAIGLWWLYFDFVSHRLPIKGTAWFAVWMYTHLPLTIGIAGIGAAILNVIEHSEEELPADIRWLLVGAIALVLLGIALLIRTLDSADPHRQAHRNGQLAIIIASVIILGLGFTGLQTTWLLSLIIILMLAPIFVGLLFLVRESSRQEQGSH